MKITYYHDQREPSVFKVSTLTTDGSDSPGVVGLTNPALGIGIEIDLNESALAAPFINALVRALIKARLKATP